MSATLTILLTPEQLEDLAERIAAKIQSPASSKGAVSFSEAAKLLGLSKATMTRQTQAGLIQTLPGLKRIPMAEIDRLLMKPSKEKSTTHTPTN